MALLIIKSNALHGTDVLLPDVGVLIPASGASLTFDDADFLFEVAQSRDLISLCQDNALGSGEHTLIINDGTNDILDVDVEQFLEDLVFGGQGGGIDETAHESLDTLTHDLVEDHYSTIRYDDQGRIIQIDFWVDDTLTTRIRRERSFYVGNTNRIHQLETAQYDGNGDPLYGVLSTYVYEGIRITSSSTVRGVALPEYPENLVAPQAFGLFQFGETLYATEGTWTNNPTTISYQWYRGSSTIPNATQPTYTLTSQDIPEIIYCRVIASNVGGSSDPIFSNVLESVWRPILEIINKDGAEGYLWFVGEGVDASADLAPVSAWSDVTGTKTFTQNITSAQPILEYFSFRDRYGVRFDGVDDYMINDSLVSYFQTESQFTMMACGNESWLGSSEVIASATNLSNSVQLSWVERVRASGPLASGEIYSGLSAANIDTAFWFENDPVGNASAMYIAPDEAVGRDYLGFTPTANAFTLAGRRYLNTFNAPLGNSLSFFAITNRLLTQAERDLIDPILFSQWEDDAWVVSKPTISGNPHRGETLTATPGTYENETSVSGQWYADNVAIPGETSTTLVVASGFDLKEISYKETVTGASNTILVSSNSLRFAPEQVLTEYWEAEDLEGSFVQDASVSSWSGRNGLYTFTSPTTANAPLFKVSSGPDTYTHLSFDGIDDYMEEPALAPLVERDQPFEILTVHQDLDVQGSSRYFWAGTSESTESWKGIRQDNATDIIAFYRSGNGSYVNNTRFTNVASTPADWIFASMNEPDAGVNSRTIDFNLYTSQGNYTPVGTINTTVNTNLTPMTNFLLASLDVGSGITQSMKVGMRSVGFVDGILAQPLREQLFDYINTKWSY